MLVAALAVSQVLTTGVVVSDSQIASDVGADILRKGGNAIDAAVATAFALAVTHPAAGNLGGGGFMVVRMADGRSVAIDYRETAPAAASRDMYIGADGKPTKESLVGMKAAGVPGTVAGMAEAHRRFGKLGWKEVVEPAFTLASKGFKVPPGLYRSLNGMREKFASFSATTKQYIESLTEGGMLVQPDLAKTFALIRDKGSDGFYRGETADRIEAAMKSGGGLITKKDLADYRVKLRKPLIGQFHGFDIVTMPPPSSGGIALLQMLGMLEKDDLAKLGQGTPATLHLEVEAMKRAFADRAVHLGDPDFVSVPTERLLDPTYLQRRRNEIGDKATPSKDVKALDGEQALTVAEKPDTTHFSVVDRAGNAVSNTYTLNGSFGSFAVAEGTGVLMNNEMDDFAAAPGVPNAYGLIQGEKNSIAPGKRPLSSMTPTIVTKDGKLVLVVGSPGGPTIINTVLQTILNVLVFDRSAQDAVSAPRYHHQWMPDEIRWEPKGLPADLRQAMEGKGHVFAAKGAEMGSCHAIAIDAQGRPSPGVDPRISTSGSAQSIR